jgi:hypothetical protein
MDNKYTTNIYPNDINKLIIKSSERNLISILRQKADTTCRYQINPSYIHKAFNTFKKGFYYTNNNDEILGFVLWKESTYVDEIKNINDKEKLNIKKLHIILICADNNDYRLGTKILSDIDSYCYKNSIKYITLESANDKLVKYYQDNDYKLIDDISLFMRKEIKIITLEKRNQKKTRKLKRKMEDTKIELEEINI